MSQEDRPIAWTTREKLSAGVKWAKSPAFIPQNQRRVS